MPGCKDLGIWSGVILVQSGGVVVRLRRETVEVWRERIERQNAVKEREIEIERECVEREGFEENSRNSNRMDVTH